MVASERDVDDFPEPLGPSIAITSGFLIAYALSSPVLEDA
jgi:hypothetical protein